MFVGGIECRPIVEAPGYFASADGRILSFIASCRVPQTPHALRPSRKGRGYQTVVLVCDGAHVTRSVHRLVAEAFHGSAPADRPHVRHLDGNPGNNDCRNLRWGTRAENAQDMIAHGTSTRGSRSPLARIDEVKAYRIKALLATQARHADIASAIGCSVSTVEHIKAGRSWAHLGEVSDAHR